MRMLQGTLKFRNINRMWLNAMLTIQSTREIFPKPRPPRKGWTQSVRNKALTRRKNPMSDPDRAAWLSGAPPLGGSPSKSQRLGGGSRAAAINRTQNSSQFKMTDCSQLNALMKSLSWNYSDHEMHSSYPLKWHCSWNTTFRLRQKWNAINIQYLHKHSSGLSRKCTVTVTALYEVSTLFMNNTDRDTDKIRHTSHLPPLR